MKLTARMSSTIADALYTIFCLATVLVWYLHIPYRIEITIVLATLIVFMFFFFKKSIDKDSEMLANYSELLENENYFRSAFNYAGNGIALISKRGHFIKSNYSLCQILGYNEEELANISIRKLIFREDFKINLKKIRNMLDGTIKSYQCVQRFYNKSGEVVFLMTMFSFINDQENKPLYFIVQFQNVNALKDVNTDIDNLHLYDSLTGLSNRSLLDQYIKEQLSLDKQTKQKFSLFILDIDSLRKINESFGHEAGDQLLKIIADRLKSSVRSGDMIARIGGDEFVIVINHVNKVEIIAEIAQKVLHNILKTVKLNDCDTYVTASIGISMIPNDGQDVASLLKNADLALYQAKQKGGNNYQFSMPDLTEHAQEKSKKQSALSQAMAKNELQLYYQPCFNMENERITSVEALIRWQSKEYGLVMPDTIIPLAEESGLIEPISEWIIRTACKQVKMWQKNGYPNLKLSINLSAYQFKNSEFMNNLISALKESEFDPNLLILEVAEGLIMHDHDNTSAILTKLKDEGISIVIDDYGTGFCSLSYLTNYSVNKIKIDGSFIKDIANEPAKLNMVSAMIAMANKLGINAVAESVETKEQYDLLKNEHCNEVQGYFLAKPMPIELMETMLATRKVDESIKI